MHIYILVIRLAKLSLGTDFIVVTYRRCALSIITIFLQYIANRFYIRE